MGAHTSHTMGAEDSGAGRFTLFRMLGVVWVADVWANRRA